MDDLVEQPNLKLKQYSRNKKVVILNDGKIITIRQYLDLHCYRYLEDNFIYFCFVLSNSLRGLGTEYFKCFVEHLDDKRIVTIELCAPAYAETFIDLCNNNLLVNVRSAMCNIYGLYVREDYYRHVSQWSFIKILNKSDQPLTIIRSTSKVAFNLNLR